MDRAFANIGCLSVQRGAGSIDLHVTRSLVGVVFTGDVGQTKSGIEQSNPQREASDERQTE